ncbi:MAG: TraR/DksA family transcriptional regulator [Deltaproteobacteria bacterium]|jgi:DnaK suppressor protein|nr:TraR/DksA family transcriptional regulator [Deltaproteobacteria bacterium]MBW2496421.1 TraR/DksA family transcriptional regulator [Deltaproteobacteria bacterium]
MAELEAEQVAELRADLEQLVNELRVQVEDSREGAKPVDLDEPIGRVSRIDAIQQQSMVQANRRAAQQRLAQARSALSRIDEGDYGECVSCGEPVSFARLKARPETPFCVVCQGSREQAR